jgi:predicted DNA-binding transcriptional regulator AlpA
MPDDHSIMFMPEVSNVARTPIATLRWWVATGKGGPKFGRLGRRIVYRRSDVEAWIDAGFAD